MLIKEILDRGIVETKHQDKSFSYTGTADFKEVAPEIFKIVPKGANPRPGSKASQNNNSYS